MSLRSDPLDRLAIPDGTTVEEHDLVTDGDVVVGGQSTVEFGVRGRNVIAGERVRFGGDIEASQDCRLDMWSDVDGNVLVGQDAYLGERVHVAGQLIVSGDLDIGDDVDIDQGFEANGWIVIRNPMPMVVFLFVYLSQLLRMGEHEAAESLWSDVTADDREHDPLLVPRSARVSDDAWRVSTPATVGDRCRLHGNLRATALTVGSDTEIFGSLRARGDVSLDGGTVVHGDVTTGAGTVSVAAGVHVRGDVSCERLELSEGAEVDGAIRARGEVTIVDDTTEPTDVESTPAEGTDDGADAADADRPAAASETPDPVPAIVRAPEDTDEEAESSDESPVPAIVPVGEDDEGDGSVDEPAGSDESTDDPSEETAAAADGGEAAEPPDADDGLAGVIAEAEER